MKQFALTLCMVLLSVMFCRAQIKPLKFDKNGEFKIVQFTDVHFKYGNPASDIALKRINEVLDAERPDLVVFTGDVVYAKPAETAMRTVLACASSRKIPFVVTFGNHLIQSPHLRWVGRLKNYSIYSAGIISRSGN